MLFLKEVVTEAQQRENPFLMEEAVATSHTCFLQHYITHQGRFLCKSRYFHTSTHPTPIKSRLQYDCNLLSKTAHILKVILFLHHFYGNFN